IAECREAIRISKEVPTARAKLGTALREQGPPDKAIAENREAITLGPQEVWFYNRLGATLAKQGKWEEAIACFRQALQIDPNRTGAYNCLAWVAATSPDPKCRDPANAVKLAQKAINLDPQDGILWNTLGVSQYRAGDWKDATVALEKSKELMGDKELSLNAFFLAMAHWQLGHKPDAQKWYEMAVGWMDKNKPQDEELRRFRAEAEELLKIEKKAAAQ